MIFFVSTSFNKKKFLISFCFTSTPNHNKNNKKKKSKYRFFVKFYAHFCVFFNIFLPLVSCETPNFYLFFRKSKTSISTISNQIILYILFQSHQEKVQPSSLPKISQQNFGITTQPTNLITNTHSPGIYTSICSFSFTTKH